MAGASLHFKSATTMACARESEHLRVHLPDKTRNSRVLVLGGTGRVGGSTAITLSKLCPDLGIVVGGRNREKGAAMVATLGENSEFSQVDINNANSLEAAPSDADLVVHAAGPFQQADKCSVLEAAIYTKVSKGNLSSGTSYHFNSLLSELSDSLSKSASNVKNFTKK